MSYKKIFVILYLAAALSKSGLCLLGDIQFFCYLFYINGFIQLFQYKLKSQTIGFCVGLELWSGFFLVELNLNIFFSQFYRLNIYN